MKIAYNKHYKSLVTYDLIDFRVIKKYVVFYTVGSCTGAGAAAATGAGAAAATGSGAGAGVVTRASSRNSCVGRCDQDAGLGKLLYDVNQQLY